MIDANLKELIPISKSNHFEVTVGTDTVLFGLSSGAALATVVGVLIDVPEMLVLVRICVRTEKWFGEEGVAQPWKTICR